MRDCTLVVPKCAPGVEFEQEVSALAVDQKDSLSGLQFHQRNAMTETTRARTIEMTTIQMIALTSFLFCMMFE